MRHNSGVTDIAEYRRQRRRAGSIRWVLILVLLLCCAVAGYFFASSDFFALRDIKIEGDQQVAESRLIELSGLTLGQNIFAMDREETAQWLCIEPRIKSAEIKRRLPGTIEISVVERQAIAMMTMGKALVTVDGEGRVLDRYTVLTELTLPLLSGVEVPANGMMPGGFIDGAGMDIALEILASLPVSAEGLGELNVSDAQNIRLYTLSGIEVRLGDGSDFAHKYLIYSNIIKDNQAENRPPIRYIDVGIPDTPAISYQ